jgi:hypothetical protein
MRLIPDLAAEWSFHELNPMSNFFLLHLRTALILNMDGSSFLKPISSGCAGFWLWEENLST